MDIAEALKTIYKNDMFPLVSQLADKDLEIYFPSLDLTIDTLKVVDDSFELSESINSGSDLVFGACDASQIKFTLADVSQDVTGLEFVVNQKVNNIYTMPLGIFKVATCTKQDDAWFKDIVAYDRMKKIDVDVSSWYNSLPFPMTLAAFRASLLSFLGLEEEIQTLPNDGMTVTKTIEPSQISGRVVLEACEEINGCFGHIGRDGKFKHVVLQPAYGLYPSETLYPSNALYPVSESDTSFVQPDFISETVSKAMYRSVKFEEYTVKEIDKLQIRQEEDDIGAIVGTGTNTYVIEGNFLVFGKGAAELENIALNAFGNMAKRPYRPYQSENIGLPYIEVGDTIAISTDDVVTGYIFQRTLTGIQALKDSYIAEGAEERTQNFGLNKEIIQLQGKAMTIKKSVEGLEVTVSDLAEDTQSRFTQTADLISSEVTRAKGKEDELSSAITQSAEQIELRVTKAGVIAAINLTSEAATIKASKINFNGFATFDVNGNLTTIDGSVLKTGTVVADTVKSTWVYAGTLNANQITAGTISGDRINGGIIQGVVLKSVGSLGRLEIDGSYIQGWNASGVNKLSIDANGNINCGNVACSTLNGYTPITSNNLQSQITSNGITAPLANNATTAGTAFKANGINYSGAGYNSVYVSSEYNFRPTFDATTACGTANGKWTSVWSVNGTIQTSDERMKTNIKVLGEDERFLRFAKMIVPYTFQMVNGTSGRYHIGFIAQRIEGAMAECGISDMEFAGLIKAPIYEKMLMDENENELNDYDTTSDIVDYSYNLRYDEFIPLLFLWVASLEKG
jgi:hypothetical protein